MVFVNRSDDETDPRRLYETEGAGTERYGSASYWDARYHLARKSAVDRLLRSLIVPGDTFLDVGCGTGEYLSTASRLGASTVVGIDLAMSYLGRLKGTTERCVLLQADGMSLPFAADSFDVVLCTEVIEHIPIDVAPQAVRELARVARGAICLTTPNRTASIRRLARRVNPARVDELDRQVGHISLLDRQQLVDLAESAGLRVTAFETRHIAPPVLGESLRLPPSLAPMVARLERVANRAGGKAGNTMYAVLESEHPTTGPSSERVR